MTRLPPLALAVVLLGSQAPAADLPVAPPPKPAAVRLPGVRLAPPGGKFWLANRLADPEAEEFRFTHEGRRLTASFDDGPRTGRLVSWDLRHPVRPPTVRQEGDGPAVRRLSPDGQVGLGFADPDAGYPHWGFFTPGAGGPVRRFDPPDTQVTVLGEYGVFSGDGRRFFARRALDPDRGIDGPGVLSVWDTRTGRRVADVPRAGGVRPRAVSHDGSAVLLPLWANWLGHPLEFVGVWEVDTGQCRWLRRPLPDDSWGRVDEWASTQFSADGTRLVTVYQSRPG